MHNRTLRSTAVALALALGSGAGAILLSAGPAAAVEVAQADQAGIAAAISAYRQAQVDLEAAQGSGGDVATAQQTLDAATGELQRLCGMLGQPDIEACIAAVTGGAAPAAEPQEEPVPPPAEETAPPPAEELAPPPAEEPAPPADTATEPPADQPPAVEAAPEEQPTAPPDQPMAEPQPDQGTAPADQGADASGPIAPPQALAEAVARYEASNAALAEAVATGADPSGLAAQVEADRVAVDTLCGQLGQTDTASCLAQFGLSLSAATVVPAPDQPPAANDQPPAAPTEQPPADTAQPPVDQGASAPADQPAAAPAEEPNPSGTPVPRELGRAIAAYEDANRQVGASVAGSQEAADAQNAVASSLADIDALCAQSGQTDRAACLAAFGLALSPPSQPLAEAPAVETPPAPPENTAPILDSAKDAEASGETPSVGPEQPAAPPPRNDAEAQSGARPAEVPSVEATKGTQVNEPPRHQRPPEAQIVQEAGPRIVFQFNNQLFVSNPSSNRLDRPGDEIYYEDLPRQRTRETIVRPDGSAVVTIYNRHGDIVQRSRFDRNGQETVLAYVPDEYIDDERGWYDPGRDLPPLQLSIPPEDYVLDADRTSLDNLTDFLDEPPVEQVQRLYSIDEVKRSARLRDMVRRLEIGNLTFEFGSSAIPPDQIGALSIVANAMLDLIDTNPAETFLIEGHTDAVGTDYANLFLSDKRAESVAIALTEVYGVPAENIATQGYGERYLKVVTEAPERVNRRVTVRRITPLVTPTDMAAN